MAGRWMVFSNNETLGPWGAARLREELRSGRIDPFDLVAQEGDSIRRPLVEVDAIFESSKFQVAEVITDPPVETPAAERLAPEQNSRLPDPVNPGKVTEGPRVFEALAAPELKRNDSEAKPQSSKTYHLIIAGSSPRGPFAAKDILRLWSAKKLPEHCEVQRVGGQTKINIRVFAGFYEPTTGVPGGRKTRRPGASALVILAAFALTSLVLALLWKASETPEGMNGAKVILENPVGVPATINPGVATPSEIQPTEAVVTPPAGGVAPASDPSAIHQKGLAPGNTKPKAAQSRITPLRPKRPEPRRAPTRDSKPPYRPAPVQPPVQPPVQGAAAKPAPANPPVRAEARPPAKPGGMVTLTGYSYDPAAFKACVAKCKLVMRGARGAVTVVFFKEAFGPQLARKSGGLTLIGQLRRDPVSGVVTLLLQDVR